MRNAIVIAIGLALAIPLNAGASPSYGAWSTPTNLGSTINSAVLDQGAALSKDGLSLYFTSSRTDGIGGNDIWVSQRESKDDAWGSPVNLGSTVNSNALDGAPTFSRDGHWMFFNSQRSGGYGGLDIWVTYRSDVNDDFDWEEPANLGEGVNTEFDDAGAAYLAAADDGACDDGAHDGDEGGANEDACDADQLYFASTRVSGAGNNDLFMATRADDGTFGSVELVEELTSDGNDIRPSIRHDGREIFFSSNRSGGQGALDIWVSTRDSLSDPWGTPTNLGSGVNGASGDQQPTLSSDGKTLIFASNRAGGSGNLDLWMVTRTKATGNH